MTAFLKYTFLLWVALITTAAANSQLPNAGRLPQLLQQYAMQQLPEYVYVHTDKNNYLCGEAIQWHLTVLDGFRGMASPLSKVAYIELLADNNQPVLQLVVGLQQGRGHGSTYLPLSMPSGQYTLKAYTAWMKNAPQAQVYAQRITIINSMHRLGNAFGMPGPFTLVAQPEGGRLVQGLTNKILVKLKTADGKLLPIHAASLTDSSGKILSEQPAGLEPWWVFTLPNAMGRYTIHASHLNQRYTTQIQTLSWPIAAHVFADSQGLHLSIQRNEQESTDLEIMLHAGGRALYYQQISASTTTLNIPLQALPSGICYLVIANAGNTRVLFERPVYNAGNKSSSLLQAPSEPVTIEANRQNTEITFLNSGNRPLYYTASIVLADSLQDLPQRSLAEMMDLYPEQAIMQCLPDDYQWQNKEIHFNQLLGALIPNHGYQWERLLQGLGPKTGHLPEYESQLIEGNIVSKATGLPAPGLPVNFSYADNIAYSGFTTTNGQGAFLMNTLPLYGEDTLALQANGRGSGEYVFRIQNPFISWPVVSTPKYENQGQPVPVATITKRSIAMQTQNLFDLSDDTGNKVDAEPYLPVYGAPDAWYLLDDYTRFITMEEVLREVVKEVRVSKQGGQFQLRIMDLNAKQLAQEAPLVLLNGAPLTDMGKLMALDPLLIKSIAVKARRFFDGQNLQYGALSIQTYTPFTPVSLMPAERYLYRWPGLVRQNALPTAMVTIPARLPDQRNVLLWQPGTILPPGQPLVLKFKSSDLHGTGKILIQGIDDQGNPTVIRYTFNITALQ